MIHFVDNDIIWKLASLDLLDVFVRVYEISADSTYGLPTAGRVFQKKKKNEPVILRRAMDFLREIQKVNVTAIDKNFLEMENIDDGEATLFTAAQQSKNFILYTGDLRSLEALNQKNLQDFHNRLRGRIVYFLQIAERIYRDDEKHFQGKNLVCDTALQTILSSRSPLDGFHSYIENCRRKTGQIIWRPT